MSTQNQHAKVVCISGQARAGKDTVAGMMKKALESTRNCRVLIIHNADLLKFMCKSLFGWNGEKDEKGRTLLQYVGTDVIRKQEPEFWVAFIIKVLNLFPEEWDYVLIPDVRFPNELSELKSAGFDVLHIHITRPLENGLTEAQRHHPSETALDHTIPDIAIANNGTLNDLNMQIIALADNLDATKWRQGKMNKPLAYIGGDIMTHGSQLARQEECDKIDAAGLNLEYYSPALNKSINDKSNMTEEENNHLAEKICEADIERLWKSDVTVMCTEQGAVGTLCEIGVLFGWKYMCDRLMEIMNDPDLTHEGIVQYVFQEIFRIASKRNFFHCSDIRTNHLPETDWRRSFGINQLLYGMVLDASSDGRMNESFDAVLKTLKSHYGTKGGE